MKQSANTENIDGKPTVPRDRLLIFLLPLAILLTSLLLGVRTLVHSALPLLAGTLRNHLGDLLQRTRLVGDRN
jgi:hypothetical protein